MGVCTQCKRAATKRSKTNRWEQIKHAKTHSLCWGRPYGRLLERGKRHFSTQHLSNGENTRMHKWRDDVTWIDGLHWTQAGTRSLTSHTSAGRWHFDVQWQISELKSSNQCVFYTKYIFALSSVFEKIPFHGKYKQKQEAQRWNWNVENLESSEFSTSGLSLVVICSR